MKSLLPPSAAGIWGSEHGCTGWVTMAAAFPKDSDTEAAREGTASHEIAAQMIDDVQLHADTDWVGVTSSNGVVFTPEMFEAASMYASDVIHEIKKAKDNAIVGCETKLTMPSVHTQNNGPVDSYVYDSKRNVLTLWDYKFGHRGVEVFANMQLVDYLVGVLHALDLDDDVLAKCKFRLRIVQPRAFRADGGPIREWALTMKEAGKYFNQLKGKAVESLSGLGKIHSGPHCVGCSARHVCPAALAAGMQLYEATADPLPIGTSPAAVGVQLVVVTRAMDALKLLKTAYEQQVDKYVTDGTIVPGWSLKQAKGALGWTSPVKDVIALGAAMGVDLSKAPQVLTPTQAIKRGLDEKMVGQVSARKTGETKVVQDKSSIIATRVFKNG